MRCPDCQKFVSYGETDPEVEDTSVDGQDGSITGTVRVVLPCADCGTELKALSIDYEFPPVQHTCEAEQATCEKCGGTGREDAECEDCDGKGEIEQECDNCGGRGYHGDEDDADRMDCGACDGDGTVMANCQTCDGDGTLNVTCVPCEGEGKTPFEDDQYAIEGEVEAVFTSRSGETGRKGFAKTYYGAELTATVICTRCDETFEQTITAEDQASSFEEQV